MSPSDSGSTLSAVVAAASSGDTIEIEAGDYSGQAAVVDKDFLRIVGVGGRPRLVADGAHVEGKGSLVVRAQGVVIENIELSGVRVDDHYGCAIRVEKGSLFVKDCLFTDNELGVMTANDSSIALDISGCEFSGLVEGQGRGSKLSHCLYAGAIDSLRVVGSYFHDGSAGHLIKSRARKNLIRYNRLTDERGVASYELEFPDGGMAEVVGNLIQQGRRSRNATIVSYGAETLRWKSNSIELLFNTIVNELPADGHFLSVRPIGVSTVVRYNVLVGRGDLGVGPGADVSSNVRARTSDFENAAESDFRPRPGASWVASVSGASDEVPPRLLPRGQYRHPTSVEPLPLAPDGSLSPGAFQPSRP